MPLTYSKRNSLAIFLIFAVTLAVIFFGLYIYQKESLKSKIYDADLQSLYASKTVLTSDISSLLRDIRFLSQNFIYHLDGATDNQIPIKNTQEKWKQIISVSDIYDQIRWIDASGKEKIRVQKNTNGIYVVPEEELQDKSNRYYFREAMQLQAGQIFVSPLDLNIEHNKIEIPHKPVLRIVTPLFDGKKRIGILILNVKANFFLDKISDTPFGLTWLTNSDGYWLRSSNSQDEWGFMLNHTKTSMPFRYPGAWKKMQSNAAGQFSDKAGIWSYLTVYPVPKDILTGGSHFLDKAQIKSAENYYWKLMVFTPNSLIANEMREKAVVLIFIYVVLLLFGYKLISSLYQARLIEEENIESIKESNSKLLAATDELKTEVSERIASERKLLFLSEQYSNVIQSTEDGFLLLDKTGKIIEVNHAFASMYGHHPSTLKNKNFQELEQINDVEKIFNQIFPDLWERGSYKVELLLKDKKDNKHCLEAALSVIYSNNQICIFFRDVTDAKESLQRFELAASVFSHAHEGIIITNKDHVILDVNAEFERITGYSRNDVLGLTPHFLRSGRHDYLFYEAMRKDLERKGHWYGEVWNRRKTGELYAEFLSISAVTDEETGEVHHYVALFTDITWEKQYQKQLERIAHYDPLTSLPNRLLLSDRLKQAMSHAEKNNSILVVAFVDLDEFKNINDNEGHEVGDALLNALSKRMLGCTRETDTVARLGGDEFIILFTNLKTEDEVFPLVESVLKEVSSPVLHDSKELQVSGSIGVTFFPQLEHVDGDQLIRQADQSMYSAKLEGKNRYHVYDPAHDKNIRGLHQSIGEIRTALERNEFVLYYQPKINMRDGCIIGFEALIRWNHPERGILGPNLFLPMIEQSEIAIEVSQWVITQALKQICDFRSAKHDYPISVNLGTVELQQSNFLEWLTRILAPFPSECEALLELEILETHVLSDIDHITNIITGCQSRGIRISLDDFGTGYSSLSYLKKLPVDVLKIDQSFVRSLFTAPEEYNMLEGIIGLVKNLDCEIIAEGVETEEHGLALINLGCDLAQGYHIARPMPASELSDWIKNWKCPESWVKAEQKAHQGYAAPKLLQ